MDWKKKFALITSFSGLTLGTVHLVNRAISFNATKMHILRRSSGDIYDWKFGRIFYKKTGIGSPLLLVHDLQSFSSSDEWNYVINELSRKHTVYAIDLLGCGRSEKPNILYTNYLYAQLISDFIKQIIGKKTDVITSGESAAFVLSACFNDSSLIDRIVMVSPPNPDDLSQVPDQSSKTLSWLINLPLVGTMLYHMLSSRRSLRKYFNRKYFYFPDSYTRLTFDTYHEAAHTDHSGSRHLFSSICGRYTTVQLDLFLPSVTNSIFIITGESNLDNRLVCKAYKELLPSIEFASIIGAKQLSHIEQPKEFINNINIFLD